MPFDPQDKKIINLGAIREDPKTRSDQVGFSKGKRRDEEDWFKFTLRKESNFNLDLDSLTQNADVFLYDSDRETILDQGNKTGPEPEKIDRPLDAGTYFLKVVPFGSDRTEYRLSLNALLGNEDYGNLAKAKRLILSQKQKQFANQIGFESDGIRDQNDYYQFTLNKQRDVNINLGGLKQNADLELLDRTGSLLFNSNNSGQQLENINVILDPDTYYIRVKPFSSDRTEYILSATAQPFGEADDQLPGKDWGILESRKRRSDRIGFGSGNNTDESDYYKFTLEEESQLNVTLEPKTANADLELYGFDADQKIIPIFSSEKGGTAIDELNPILDAGDYFVRVKKVGNNRTQYDLNLLVDPDIKDEDGDIPGQPLADVAIDPTKAFDVNDPTSQKIFTKTDKIGFGRKDNRDLNDYYSFTLLEKGDVNITLDELAANANLELLDSSGTVKDSSTKGRNNSEQIQEVLDAGTYYIRIFPKNQNKTKYKLRLSANLAEDDYPNPKTAKQLGSLDEQDRIGERNKIGYKEGSITDKNDFYEFSIRETSGFNLKLDQLTANANVYLFDSELNEKASSRKGGTKADQITEELQPGDYFVNVMTPGRAGTDYLLNLEAKPVSELDPDRTPETAQSLGVLENFNNRDRIGFSQLGVEDTTDFYRFEIAEKSDLDIKINKINSLLEAQLFSADDLGVLSAEPILEQKARKPFSTSETLNPGIYYLKIEGNKTQYNLNLKVQPFEPLLGFEETETTVTEGDLDSMGEPTIQTLPSGVKLSEASTQTVTVDYTIVDRQATRGEDYNVSSPTGTLTFAPGETRQTIPVEILGDIAPEKDEFFLLKLSNASQGKLDQSRLAKITIANDDLPEISIGDVSIEESNSGTQDAVFTVSMDRPSDERVRVNYVTKSGTAKVNDYTHTRGQLTFRPGDTSKEIKVPVKGDRRLEEDETFLLNLRNPKGATLADSEATGTIVDNDFPMLSIGDVSLPEGDPDPMTGEPAIANFEFPVTLSEPTNKTMTVNYTIKGRQAILGEDYDQPASGTVTFAPGETEQTIAVPVIGDAAVETDETFVVKLDAPNGWFKNRGDRQGTGTILNDELPQMTIEDVSIEESNSGTQDAVFTVSMDRPSDERVRVNYVTKSGTAKVNDYTRTRGQLTFRPGDTSKEIKVPVKGDRWLEEDETFLVNLRNPKGATLADSEATGTIVDNDFPMLSIGDGEIEEGKSGVKTLNFPITLNRPGLKTLTVDYATIDDRGTATADTDYTATSGQLSLAPEETEKTISVEVLGDEAIEDDERFFVGLSNIVNGNLKTTASDRRGEGTIVNDDWPTIDIADAVVVEGDSRLKIAVFDVSLDRPSNRSVKVRYSTENDTAGGGDYNGESNTLTIPKGETTAPIRIRISGDQNIEPDETFGLKLFQPQNGVLPEEKAELRATGIILDNDDPLTGDRQVMSGTPEADIFELGTAEGSLYAENGDADYAAIVNFDPTQDTIQLQGSPGDYQLVPNAAVGLIDGTAIYRVESGEELIGLVKDGDSLSLESGFSFL